MSSSRPSAELDVEASTAASVVSQWQARATQFQEVHDRSPDGMMIFKAVRDAGGEIVDFEWLYSNPAASLIVGRRAEDLLGKRLLVEMPGNKAAGLFDIYVEIVASGVPHSHEFAYRHEGLDSWFRATSIRLGDGFYVAFSDLTERKRAEDQAARLAAIVRSSEHAIYSTTDAGVVDTWNQGAEKLYGYTSAEMVGQPVSTLVPEGRRAEHRRFLASVLERGGVETWQTERLTKAGDLVHVSLMISPIVDSQSHPVGAAIIARDISQQMRMQEQLLVAGRMASVGTLAAGMAHEINNPLAAVTGNLDLVIEELQALGREGQLRASALHEMAVDARDGAERIRKLVLGLMTFSRANDERGAVLHLGPLLDLSADVTFGEIRHRARLVKEYGSPPAVVAHAARLGQVFFNLLVNATQAIAERPSGDHELRITTDVDATGRAVVEIRDTGPGIPAGLGDRIFEPFFTTRHIGAGAGLGLTICRNIVNGLGGEITVSRNDAGGATFRVSLPAAPEQSVNPPVRAVKVGASTRRAAVLVVDDEPALGTILTRILRNHDVTVVAEAKAVLVLLASGKRFDIIISDLMMPEMTGMDLHDEVARTYPDVVGRMVFMTGGVFTGTAADFLDRVANEHITKPFEADVVRALVQRYLKD